jgi:hypothetical protein
MRQVSHYSRPNVLVPRLSPASTDGLLKTSYRSTRLLIGVSVFFRYAVTISLTEARVVTYNFCLQDNSSGYSLQINSATGEGAASVSAGIVGSNGWATRITQCL